MQEFYDWLIQNPRYNVEFSVQEVNGVTYHVIQMSKENWRVSKSVATEGFPNTMTKLIDVLTDLKNSIQRYAA